MNGLMMQQPLLISSLLRHAERHHATQQVVSRRVEGDTHHCTFADVATRSRRMADALGRLGVQGSDRVGTLAWNGYRHLELYFAVSGSGAVLHTINPRLHLDHLRYMVEHAGDRVLFFDLGFLPIVEALASRVDCVQWYVAMTDRAHMPVDSKLDGLLCYEDLIEANAGDSEWPNFDENRASTLCYTSGTTGHPKGVLYSHRSTLLHTFAIALPDAFNISAVDAIMPVVPMFHVNAWGLTYAAFMTGAKLVFPGPALDGQSLHRLIESEQVTLSAGVPTIWQGLLAFVEANDAKFTTMRRTIIGGSACPPAMMIRFEQDHDVQVLHAWGMTELSPVGTVAVAKRRHAELVDADRLAMQSSQGRVVFGVDMKVCGDDGAELPWDGKSAGQLLVRGPWVVRDYFSNEGADPLVADAHGDAWFPTGDVATIDADGFMRITDRSKDVIKSGGEWIGSIDIENIASAHPAVAMAACIAAAHPKWGERPLLIVVRKPEVDLTRDELIGFFEGRVAGWWIPDDVIFVDAIPLGATGKVLKNQLRARYADHLVAATR